MNADVSPPPEVPADVRKAAIRAFHGAFNAIGSVWDLSYRIELAARAAFAAGVAAGRTQAASPRVEVDPAVRFGAPHIRGISCEAIAGMYAAGEPPEVVCEDYGISRHELLLALWSEAQHGTYGRRRKKWKAWADKVAPALGGHVPLDVDAIELPEGQENT